MTERDYILRMIEQFGVALARLRRLLAAGASGETVRRELDLAGRQVGIDFDMARLASEDTLAALLTAGGEVNPSRCWMTAELLFLDGLDAEAAGETDAARLSYRKALTLYSLIRPHGVFLVGWPEAAERTEEIRERIRVLDRGAVIGLYDRHASAYDADRSRGLQERSWLDRFLSGVRPGGTVLDVGCGTGEPIARYLLERGFGVVGVDAAPAMIELCRARYPESEWLVADMRGLELGRRFDGVLAWDSFFHLGADDQRALFPRFAAHSAAGAPLLFTSGSAAGEAIGCYRGDPLHHASLDPAEYEELLASNGFTVAAYVADDPECGHHTVWLAHYRS
jgi:SAM-dependent methyltransferase